MPPVSSPASPPVSSPASPPVSSPPNPPVSSPPNPPGPRRRLPPEERKAQLLGTALEVFARRGFGRAGHAEIAEAAGVAVSTVFLYFKTREILVDAVLSEIGRFYLDLALRVHHQEKPCRQILVDHRIAFHGSLDSHPHHARLALDWSTAMREELWPRYIELTDRLVANHMRTIRRGQAQGEVSPSIDPETSARMLIASAQMTAQQRLLGADPAMVDRMALLFIDAALGRGPGAGPEADRAGPREDALQG